MTYFPFSGMARRRSGTGEVGETVLLCRKGHLGSGRNALPQWGSAVWSKISVSTTGVLSRWFVRHDPGSAGGVDGDKGKDGLCHLFALTDPVAQHPGLYCDCQ